MGVPVKPLPFKKRSRHCLQLFEGDQFAAQQENHILQIRLKTARHFTERNAVGIEHVHFQLTKPPHLFVALVGSVWERNKLFERYLFEIEFHFLRDRSHRFTQVSVGRRKIRGVVEINRWSRITQEANRTAPKQIERPRMQVPLAQFLEKCSNVIGGERVHGCPVKRRVVGRSVRPRVRTCPANSKPNHCVRVVREPRSADGY